jgi:succinylglutamate desuccinylase
MHQVQTYLDQFQALAQKHSGPIPWTLTFDFGKHDKHMVFGAITHGNETGSLPGFVQMGRALAAGDIEYGGRVTLMLGNIEACKQDRRFLEADLNRVFLEEAPESLEKTRAFEMMQVLDQADVFIDFHQTIEPSEKPFYIFPFHESGYQWAKLLGGGTSLITRDSRHAFSQGCVCADEYARKRGIPGITLEMGQKGITDIADKLTWQTMERALAALDKTVAGQTIPTQLESLTPPEFEFIEIQYSQSFGGPRSHLNPGLLNFTWVNEGEVIGKHDDGSDMVVPQAGYLVFPKYPRRDEEGLVIGRAPGQIYNLAVKMAEHPLIAFA